METIKIANYGQWDAVPKDGVRWTIKPSEVARRIMAGEVWAKLIDPDGSELYHSDPAEVKAAVAAYDAKIEDELAVDAAREAAMGTAALAVFPDYDPETGMVTDRCNACGQAYLRTIGAARYLYAVPRTGETKCPTCASIPCKNELITDIGGGGYSKVD
jgi:hypothetical protein